MWSGDKNKSSWTLKAILDSQKLRCRPEKFGNSYGPGRMWPDSTLTTPEQAGQTSKDLADNWKILTQPTRI